MTDIPKAGFFCAGKTPLALSCSIRCAYKMMEVFKTGGFDIGACHTEITGPFSEILLRRAEKTLMHMCSCCDLVISVGCEGFSVSDIMPDITEKLCTKQVPYFTSVLCGSRKILKNEGSTTARIYPEGGNGEYIFCPSRACAGIYGKTLVMNFPSNLRVSTGLAETLLPAINFTVYNISGKSARSSYEFKNFVNSSLEFHEVFKKECIVNHWDIVNLPTIQ